MLYPHGRLPLPTHTMTTAPLHDSTLAQDVADFCRGQVPDAQQQRSSFPSSELWAAVAKTGTSLWLDTGDVDAARELWVQEFVALTTNNTLLNKEVQKGIYDELVPGAARLLQDKGVAGAEVVQEVAFVLNAVHGLKQATSGATCVSCARPPKPASTYAPARTRSKRRSGRSSPVSRI